jgi:hypothetical protein
MISLSAVKSIHYIRSRLVVRKAASLQESHLKRTAECDAKEIYYGGPNDSESRSWFIGRSSFTTGRRFSHMW